MPISGVYAWTVLRFFSVRGSTAKSLSRTHIFKVCIWMKCAGQPTCIENTPFGSNGCGTNGFALPTISMPPRRTAVIHSGKTIIGKPGKTFGVCSPPILRTVRMSTPAWKHFSREGEAKIADEVFIESKVQEEKRVLRRQWTQDGFVKGKRWEWWANWKAF